jgi:A/G-specific adenine glycosylase
MSNRLPAADARWIAAARKLLPRWWRRCRRDMPWRRTGDPYAIWVSEVMLQQTQVATVKSYYRRFLQRFPTIRALARASLGEVLKVWQGLGYYSRARNMHAAAAAVVREFGGRLPRTVQELRRLPGVGRYTAAAVASIAFGADEAVLDGNVIRVLARGFAIRGDVGKAATQRRLWALASGLVPPGRAGLFNQAMMDLGATVCTPRHPQCGLCPLRTLCRAHRLGKETDFPRKAPRRPVPHVDVGVAVVWRGGRVLIDQRKTKGLLGGLWEFPNDKAVAGETPARAARRASAEQLGIRIGVLGPLTTIHHAYSHFRLTLHVFRCRYVSGRCKAIGCEAFRWVRLAELDDYPFSVAHLKIFTSLRGAGAGHRAPGKNYLGKNV